MRKLVCRFWAWVTRKRKIEKYQTTKPLKVQSTVLPESGKDHLEEHYKEFVPKKKSVKQSLSPRYNSNVVRGEDGRFKSKKNRDN